MHGRSSPRLSRSLPLAYEAAVKAFSDAALLAAPAAGSVCARCLAI